MGSDNPPPSAELPVERLDTESARLLRARTGGRQGSIAVVDDDDGDDIELPNGNDRDSTQIESYADEASGASGSPMYSWFTNGEMYAIGAHHGRETDWELFGSDTHSVASGGDGFVGLIKWARQAWP